MKRVLIGGAMIMIFCIGILCGYNADSYPERVGGVMWSLLGAALMLAGINGIENRQRR